jgi:hypothetical protein
MLYKETVDQSTLELLIQLQQKEYLKGFYLVGGIALALKMGHRKSVDLDLFSNFSFDSVQLLDNLSTDFSFTLFFSANNTLKGSINQVQVDIIDIYFLLEIYSIEEMIGFYKKKYSQYNEANVLKSLCWFEEVDLSDWPVLLKTPKLRWETVKKTITKATFNYLRKIQIK